MSVLRMTEAALAARLAKQNKVSLKAPIKQKPVVLKRDQVVNEFAPKAKLPTEHEEQVKVIEWADAHPLAGLIFAIPNGANKSPAMAAKFKREGLRSGVPDLFLPVPRGTFCGLFIEMKRRKGGKVSANQIAWFRALNKHYCVATCRGADEAIDNIMQYLALKEV